MSEGVGQLIKSYSGSLCRFISRVPEVIPALGGGEPAEGLARRRPQPVRRPPLPPYSPELSPIELAFSKLKQLPRSAAGRTVEGLWAAIGRALGQFPRAEASATSATGATPLHRPEGALATQLQHIGMYGNGREDLHGGLPRQASCTLEVRRA
jgi:hypothetical protein